MKIIMMGCRTLLLLFFIPWFFCESASAEFVVSLRSPETNQDQREAYTVELINLALQKTQAEYGDFKLLAIPPMNTARSVYSLQVDAYPNLLVELSYQQKLERDNDLIYINFPVELGIVGYRVCFVSPAARERVEHSHTLAELKQFTIGQGMSWADTDILRYNGFKVVEVSNFKSIFAMVANNRIDLFCRGANELESEYDVLKADANILYDNSFVLFYSLPRFYYLNKKNLLAKQRIEKGLLLAYQDGSVNTLWEKHFLDSVKFATLKARTLYKLENPFTSSLHENYQKYFYNPLE